MSTTTSRHAAPVFISDADVIRPLTHLRLGQSDLDGKRREAFIQDLVHRRPEVIPMSDIEPAFHPLIAACREMATLDGLFVDNVWVTPWGGVVLGECKLVRNPEARREVVVQALDYARALHGWSYAQLEAAIGTARGETDFSLWNLVREHSDLDEGQFVDTINRKLRFGRILLLIIGDGIQENVEALSEYLQLHAGLHVAMALVDLSIWQGLDGGLLIVPRIPMRTTLIERGIVVFDVDAGGRIEPVAPSVSERAVRGRSFTLSESEFMDQLEEKRPGLPARLRPFLDSLQPLGVTPEFRKSLVLRWYPSPDVKASFGYIDSFGRVSVTDGWGYAMRRVGNPKAADRYLQAIADAIGGHVKRYDKADPAVVDPAGRAPDLATLLQVQEAWRDAISTLASESAQPHADPQSSVASI